MMVLRRSALALLLLVLPALGAALAAGEPASCSSESEAAAAHSGGASLLQMATKNSSGPTLAVDWLAASELRDYTAARDVADSAKAKDSTSSLSASSVSSPMAADAGSAVPVGNLGRRVYIDMGANWANTLRLFLDLVPGADAAGPWEIYAFEADPFIQPYVESFVHFLNGVGPKPDLTIPPSGSLAHLRILAPEYGCPALYDADALRDCMVRVFSSQLAEIRPDPLLNSTDLVEARLAVAGTPLAASAGRSRFTFIPAAVSDYYGYMDLGAIDPGYAIAGGSIPDDREDGDNTGGMHANVLAVNVAHWLATNFQPEDYIVIKMDVEGAEFPILQELYRMNKLHLIDLLAYECHYWMVDQPSPFEDCTSMTATLEREHVNTLVEGAVFNGYLGWDSFSLPEVYKPVKPE